MPISRQIAQASADARLDPLGNYVVRTETVDLWWRSRHARGWTVFSASNGPSAGPGGQRNGRFGAWRMAEQTFTKHASKDIETAPRFAWSERDALAKLETTPALLVADTGEA